MIQTGLKQGQNYYGEAVVAGNKTQTAYQPILDKQGNTIGMWYVGVSQAFIDKIISTITISLVIVLSVGAILAVIVFLWFTKRIKKRLDAVRQAMEKAGEGEFRTTLHDKSKDEFGQLAQNFNLMKDNLQLLIQQVSETSTSVNS